MPPRRRSTTFHTLGTTMIEWKQVNNNLGQTPHIIEHSRSATVPLARSGVSSRGAPFSPRCRPRGCAAARQPPLSLSGRDPRRWDAAMDRAGISVFDVEDPRTSRLLCSFSPSSASTSPSPLAATTGPSRERKIRWGLLEVHMTHDEVRSDEVSRLSVRGSTSSERGGGQGQRSRCHSAVALFAKRSVSIVRNSQASCALHARTALHARRCIHRCANSDLVNL